MLRHRYMDYLDEDNEVPNPGARPDPTYSPPGSSVASEAAASEPCLMKYSVVFLPVSLGSCGVGDGGSVMAKQAREQ